MQYQALKGKRQVPKYNIDYLYNQGVKVIIYPAIDLKDKKCVRLKQGKFDRVKVYSDDPAQMAKKWVDQGAKYLHVVDLDGAKDGVPVNLSIVEDIIESAKIPVQLGGGIRNFKAIEQALSIGVDRVILGTTLIEQKGFLLEACECFGPEKIVAGVDSKNGKVVVSGWQESSEIEVIRLIKALKFQGVKHVIMTDILTDGMQTGPNYSLLKEAASLTDLSIIASGGINVIDDIVKLKKLESLGIDGVIIGTALYEETINLAEAIRIAD